jgi:hypothetical protein
MAPGHALTVPSGDDGYELSHGPSWSCAIVSGRCAVAASRPDIDAGPGEDLLVRAGQPTTGSPVVVTTGLSMRTPLSALQ